MQVCLASPDPYEDNDTPQTAKWLPLDQVQTHNFDRPGNQDWVKFAAQAGQTYTVHTGNLGPFADTYLYLYDTNGTTITEERWIPRSIGQRQPAAPTMSRCSTGIPMQVGVAPPMI